MAFRSAAVLILTAMLAATPAAAAEDQPSSTAGEAKAAVKDGAHAVGHATRETTRAIGHGTRDAAKAVGHATRDAAKGVGHAARDAWQTLTGPSATPAKQEPPQPGPHAQGAEAGPASR